MSFDGLYDIRPAISSDMSFIMATFLRGLYYGNSYFRQIPKDIFMAAYKRVAEAAWTSPNIRIRVACLKEDSDVILGYSVCSSDEKAIIWMFVKTAWRKQGIGRSLLPHSPIYATHLTETGKMLMNKMPGLAFNPFY
jgi:hypothetical protein